nr:transposase for insertion sequence element IS904 [Bradyrhizobium sp. DOA9]
MRGLVPSAPDRIWVADITYVHLARTFAYLAVILDAFWRKAVGWAFEDTLDASLAIAALEKAIVARGPATGSLIHHSAQYASIAYRQRLADRDITISMSRPGNPFDNAKAESFMKKLKAEEINGNTFIDLTDARRRIDCFIAEVYNKERFHSALGYQSPLEFETAFAQNRHDNASWQPHCHCNYRVSLRGCSPTVLFLDSADSTPIFLWSPSSSASMASPEAYPPA